MRRQNLHTWIVVVLALSLPASIAVMNMSAALLTAVLLWRALAGDKLSVRDSVQPIALALGLYVAVGLIAGLAGISPENSLSTLNKELHKLWIFAIIWLAMRLAPVPEIPWALGAGFGVMALYGITQSLFLVGPPGQPWIRAHGFVHPFTFGMQMCLAVLGGLCYFSRPEAGRSKRTVLLTGLLTGACLVALVFNQTRTVLVGLIVGFAAISLVDPFWKKKTKWAALAGAAGIVIYEFLPTGRSLFSALHTLLSPGNALPAQFQRFTLWDVALKMFKDHPLLGVGPNNYRLAFNDYFSGLIEGETAFGSAHNLYLHHLAERGLIGLAVLLILFYVMTARALERARQAPTARNTWAFAAMIAFLVINLGETAFHNELLTSLVIFIWTWAEATHPAPRH